MFLLRGYRFRNSIFAHRATKDHLYSVNCSKISFVRLVISTVYQSNQSAYPRLLRQLSRYNFQNLNIYQHSSALIPTLNE